MRAESSARIDVARHLMPTRDPDDAWWPDAMVAVHCPRCGALGVWKITPPTVVPLCPRCEEQP